MPERHNYAANVLSNLKQSSALNLSNVPDYLSLQILRTDISGMPLEWVTYREAARLHHLNLIAYTMGSILYELHGGINAHTGTQSILPVHSIIATQGNTHILNKVRDKYVPPLNNRTLFKRDAFMCLYCGKKFMVSKLSRDHVKPVSQGGSDVWTNVVTACRRCNNHKAGNTPEQANMQLLAIPFAPNHAEYIYLKGRRILADQMEFLQQHFPRRSRLREEACFSAKLNYIESTHCHCESLSDVAISCQVSDGQLLCRVDSHTTPLHECVVLRCANTTYENQISE